MPVATLHRFRLTAEWFDAIQRRTSRRRFEDRRIDTATLDRVGETCRMLGTAQSGARAVLVRRAPRDVFTGFVGSYGKIGGAPSLVAFVGGPDALVDVGYLGEAVILDATLADLDTCWIAGSFDAKRAGGLVDLDGGERVLAVTPIGYATERHGSAEKLLQTLVKPRRRLDLGEIAPGHESWPLWAREAVDAVRPAPSGGNSQPWRLRMEDGALVLSEAAKTYWTAPMDLGIAMLHAELGALHSGVSGTWEAPSGEDFARFTPDVRQ